MYLGQEMKLKALSVGKEALGFPCKIEVKRNAILSFIRNTEPLKNLDFSDIRTVKVLNDRYLSLCVQVLIQIKFSQVKDLELFEDLMKFPLRYEGIFLNWIRAYKVNKIRENRYKITQNSYEDKRDPHHPLFYYKAFKNYLHDIKASHGMYLGLDIAVIWKNIGKEFCEISLNELFFIIQAKSYLRSDIFKSVKKIKKAYLYGSSNKIIKYLFVKYKVEAAKLTQEVSKKKMNRVFQAVNELSKLGLTDRQTAKVLYMVSELHYINRAFGKSLELYKESSFIFNKLKIRYLTSKKRLISERLLEDKLKKDYKDHLPFE